MIGSCDSSSSNLLKYQAHCPFIAVVLLLLVVDASDVMIIALQAVGAAVIKVMYLHNNDLSFFYGNSITSTIMC